MRRRSFSWVFRLAAVILVLTALAYMGLLRRYRPIALDLAKTQVVNHSLDLINNGVTQQVREGDIQYDRIIYFEKDLDGKITALKTNMSEVNRLKTDLLHLIGQEMLALDTRDIGIPLGSICLPELFSGKGPLLPVKIMSISSADASFTSEFSEAGINQTLHRLYMQVRIDATVLVLGRTETFPVESQVLVAETVIVGTVPGTFLQLEGSLLGKNG